MKALLCSWLPPVFVQIFLYFWGLNFFLCTHKKFLNCIQPRPSPSSRSGNPSIKSFLLFVRKWMSQCKCTVEKLKNEPKSMQFHFSPWMLIRKVPNFKQRYLNSPKMEIGQRFDHGELIFLKQWDRLTNDGSAPNNWPFLPAHSPTTWTIIAFNKVVVPSFSPVIYWRQTRSANIKGLYDLVWLIGRWL